MNHQQITKLFYNYFSLILCHYNEIGLKAPRYKQKLEDLVIYQVKQLSKRENLSLEEVIQIPNRLLFAFPNDQLLNACNVFRYILGIQSFSPAFPISKDLSQIKQNLVEFSSVYLRTKDKFSIKFKSIHALSKKFRTIEKEIGAFLVTELKSHKIFVKFINGITDKIIYIELREDSGYVYTNKIPTLWGGMPLELSKNAFCIFSGIPEELVASHLMMRRGTHVIPVIFSMESNQKQIAVVEESISAHLSELAQFHPDPMNYILIDFNPILGIIIKALKLEKKVATLLTQISPCVFCLLIQNKMQEFLMKLSDSFPLITIRKRVINSKTFISLVKYDNLIGLSFENQFDFLTLYPLQGLSDNSINHFYSEIMAPKIRFSKFESLIKKSIKPMFQVNKILHPINIKKNLELTTNSHRLYDSCKYRTNCSFDQMIQNDFLSSAEFDVQIFFADKNLRMLISEFIVWLDEIFQINQDNIRKYVHVNTITRKIL